MSSGEKKCEDGAMEEDGGRGWLSMAADDEW